MRDYRTLSVRGWRGAHHVPFYRALWLRAVVPAWTVTRQAESPRQRTQSVVRARAARPRLAITPDQSAYAGSNVLNGSNALNGPDAPNALNGSNVPNGSGGNASSLNSGIYNKIATKLQQDQRLIDGLCRYHGKVGHAPVFHGNGKNVKASVLTLPVHPALHVSLSAAPGEKLADDQWREIGQKYLRGITLL